MNAQQQRSSSREARLSAKRPKFQRRDDKRDRADVRQTTTPCSCCRGSVCVECQVQSNAKSGRHHASRSAIEQYQISSENSSRFCQKQPNQSRDERNRRNRTSKRQRAKPQEKPLNCDFRQPGDSGAMFEKEFEQGLFCTHNNNKTMRAFAK